MQFNVGDKVAHKIINYSKKRETAKHSGVIIALLPKSARVQFENGFIKVCPYNTLEKQQ